ncbi:tyrosine-type recombinase/integrase [Aeromonas caviae]
MSQRQETPHPLLAARSALNQVDDGRPRYGRAARKHRRQRNQQQIAWLGLTTLEKYLPKLFHQPPQSELFALLWPRFIEGLGLACDSEARFRAALNYVVKLLHLGNTRGLWQLPLPSLALEVRRTPQRYHDNWLAHSRAVLAAEAHWRQQIDAGLPDDPARLLADIVHSAAMHSGLNSASELHQLALAIARRAPLYHNGQQIWLELDSVESARPTNALRDDDTLTTQWRFFPALPTLGLLYRWYRSQPDGYPPTVPVQRVQFDHWLQPRLYPPLRSLAELARYGSVVAECQHGVAWPQILVGVASGALTTASLPHASWQALHHIALPSVATLCQLPLRPGEVYRPPATMRGRQATPYSTFLQQLRTALGERSSATHKKTRAQALTALRAIDTSPLCLAEQLLHGWFCHALAQRRNQPSSLRTYLSNGGVQWLTRCHGHDIGQWSGETWLDHYRDLLQQYTNPSIDPTPLEEEALTEAPLAADPSTQVTAATTRAEAASRHASYVANRLTQLHQFGVRHFHLAPLPERLLDGLRQRPHVRAGLISEPLFNTLLQTLDTHPDIAAALREKLLLITLIAGRAGLRLSELIKLRVQDIDDHPDSWLRVRNTRLDDGKTDSARRNIPLGVLLTESEAQRLQRYVHQMHIKRGHDPQALLFPSEAGNLIPLCGEEITTPIVTLLRACGDPTLVFHHLRHSALGKLQLALHHQALGLHAHPEGLGRNLLPWDATQCQRIVTAVTGDHRPAAYWALAQFAGHQGPDTTLHSYLHLCDWITAACLQQAQWDWSPAQRRYFTGLSVAQLRAHGLDQGPLSDARCRPLLQGKMTRLLRRVAITHQQIAPLPLPAKRKVDFFVVQEALRLVEQGKSLFGLLASYALTAHQISEWIDKIHALGQLQTRRQRSRLIAANRSRSLLPGPQRSHHEQQELSQLVKAARNLYRSQPAALTRWLVYLLRHTTTSNHGIRFSDPAALRAFIHTTAQLLPANRLALTLHCHREDLGIWQQDLPGGLNPNIIKLAANTRQRNRATLRIRHPNEQALLAKHQAGPTPHFAHYSTPVLTLLAYVISLQVFSVEEIQEWVKKSP